MLTIANIEARQKFTQEDIEYAFGRIIHNTEKLAITNKAAKFSATFPPTRKASLTCSH